MDGGDGIGGSSSCELDRVIGSYGDWRRGAGVVPPLHTTPNNTASRVRERIRIRMESLRSRSRCMRCRPRDYTLGCPEMTEVEVVTEVCPSTSSLNHLDHPHPPHLQHQASLHTMSPAAQIDPDKDKDTAETPVRGIQDHALIGNLQTAALVSVDGSIESMCIPNFDSPSVFARIIDADKGGHFSISPTWPFKPKQAYAPNSNVLVTKFLSEEGVATLTDLLVPRGANRTGSQSKAFLPWLIRRVESIRGTVPFRLECAPAFNYCRDKHTVEVGLPALGIHAEAKGRLSRTTRSLLVVATPTRLCSRPRPCVSICDTSTCHHEMGRVIQSARSVRATETARVLRSSGRLNPSTGEGSLAMQSQRSLSSRRARVSALSFARRASGSTPARSMNAWRIPMRKARRVSAWTCTVWSPRLASSDRRRTRILQ